MISMKTGYMIGLCSHLGSICAGASVEVQSKMKKYGLEIGKAYQIQDDYMEIYSSEDIMKKSLKSDIELNKKTYMICLASDIDPEGLNKILSLKVNYSDKIVLLRDFFDDGSMANTATLKPSLINFRPNDSMKVDFPTPGTPVMPILIELSFLLNWLSKNWVACWSSSKLDSIIVIAFPRYFLFPSFIFFARFFISFILLKPNCICVSLFR